MPRQGRLPGRPVTALQLGPPFLGLRDRPGGRRFAAAFDVLAVQAHLDDVGPEQ